MSMIRPRRSRDRALGAIRAHFRETGTPPSLSDMARRLACSRQRAWELVIDLERQELITRTPGQAFSIRLVEPACHLSDDELLHEVRARGLLAAGIGQALLSAYHVDPLTTLKLPDAQIMNDLLAKLGDVPACGGRPHEQVDAAGEGRGYPLAANG